MTGYLPKDDGLKQAFTGADIVVIPAGIPRECIAGKRPMKPLTPTRQARHDP